MTMTDRWREYALSADGTHHVHLGCPAYERRFIEALKFHAPGLAPVIDASGAYHITVRRKPRLRGTPPLRTFGFYEGIAACPFNRWLAPQSGPTARRSYQQRYQWCGNFQEARCPVRDAGRPVLPHPD